MAGIDLSGLTLNPIEVQEIKDFIIERVFEHPQIQAIHNMQTGVKVKEQIVFAGQFGKTGLKKTTSCDLQTSGAESVLTEKYWDPVGIEDTLILCQVEVNALFKAYYTKVQRYRDLYDITGSDLEIFYAIMIEESMVRTIWRAAWFGDTAVAAAAAGTPGLVDAATNVKFYDYIDGLWKQIFAGVTATTINRVTITENAVTTSKANQLALAAGAAVAYFKAVYEAADVRLRSNPEAQMLVTRELFDNYLDYLEDKGVAYDIDIMQNGLKSLKYRGIQVVNMETVWGLDSREDFVNNTTDNVYYLPHRIVFTDKFNIPIGTLNEDDFSELRQWYNEDERKNKTTYGFTEDAKVLEEYMITVAY